MRPASICLCALLILLTGCNPPTAHGDPVRDPGPAAHGVTTPAAAPITTATPSAASTTITEGRSFGHLTIYLVRGSGTVDTRNHMTLQEALEAGQVVVRETGTVNQLTIENRGDRPVFVQSGDIVKGGRQDRTLAFDLLVAARSGPTPLAAFCVEHGRWQQRGGEGAHAFASCANLATGNALKRALKGDVPGIRATPADALASAPGSALNSRTPAEPQQVAANQCQPVQQTATSTLRDAENAGPPDQQSLVWREVAHAQQELSSKLGASVHDANSQTSLQLSLENTALKHTANEYVTALRDAIDAYPDALGFAFAIDGRLNYADVYAAPSMFRKQWPRLLYAAAVEAITEGKTVAVPVPSAAEVQIWMTQTAAAPAVERRIADRTLLRTRKAGGATCYETVDDAGLVVHRAFAK